jgi:hypothetical protein
LAEIVIIPPGIPCGGKTGPSAKAGSLSRWVEGLNAIGQLDRLKDLANLCITVDQMPQIVAVDEVAFPPTLSANDEQIGSRQEDRPRRSQVQIAVI